MSHTGTRNLERASLLATALATQGIRRAVISPGARSTPLTLALLRHPSIAVDVVLDERVAAFLALGLAKASGLPVALVATSGSAPGHWLPAVMEAAHSAIPLILLSADRPPELHHCGANQTTDQTRLFGAHLRAQACLDALDELTPEALLSSIQPVIASSRAPFPGPVHLNLPFREPLLPPPEALATQGFNNEARPAPPFPPGLPVVLESELSAILPLLRDKAGWIVCGESAFGEAASSLVADALHELATQLACPVLIEPLSGLRFAGDASGSPYFCTHQEAWARKSPATPPAWVIRLGGYPVTRSVQQAILAANHIVIEPYPRLIDPAHRASHRFASSALTFCHTLTRLLTRQAHTPQKAQLSMLRSIQTAEQQWSAHRQQLALTPGLHEAAVIPSLFAAMPPLCPLFIGNSLPIRDLDAFSGHAPHVHPIYGNRGLSGIDGNLAITAGLAKIHGRAVALLGDLSFQHDLSALAVIAQCAACIVVINNGGGGIFATLDTATLPEFETAWLSPQQLDLCAAARAFGIHAERCTTLPALEAALAAAMNVRAACVIEVVVDRLQSQAMRTRYWQGPSI